MQERRFHDQHQCSEEDIWSACLLWCLGVCVNRQLLFYCCMTGFFKNVCICCLMCLLLITHKTKSLQSILPRAELIPDGLQAMQSFILEGHAAFSNHVWLHISHFILEVTQRKSPETLIPWENKALPTCKKYTCKKRNSKQFVFKNSSFLTAQYPYF